MQKVRLWIGAGLALVAIGAASAHEEPEARLSQLNMQVAGLDVDLVRVRRAGLLHRLERHTEAL